MNLIRTIALVALMVFSFAVLAEPIDINTADADTIAASLKGVGPEKAAAIVAYRDQYGPFASADDLLNVKGIGQKTLETNLENITVNDRASNR